MFQPKTDPLALDLLSRLLVYDPVKRIKPQDALDHAYFDELRQQSTRLPNGNCLPDLFNFSECKLIEIYMFVEEMNTLGIDKMHELVPHWYKRRSVISTNGRDYL